VWLICGAVFASFAMTLQTGTTLSHFSDTHLAAVVVALSFVRVIGPILVGTAAWYGVCSATRRGARFPRAAFLAAIALYPVPILLGLVISAGTLTLGFGVSQADFWSNVTHHLRQSDLVAGVTQTAAYVLALSVAGAAIPWLKLQYRGRVSRIAITWLLGAIAMAVARFVSTAVLALN
jgi:ABC-type transporter Mla maintaining outer membrane lipid asymmetry permease subunit MlaE